VPPAHGAPGVGLQLPHVSPVPRQPAGDRADLLGVQHRLRLLRHSPRVQDYCRVHWRELKDGQGLPRTSGARCSV
jgi:hypothetical protein